MKSARLLRLVGSLSVYATLDLPGAETTAFRLEASCVEVITIELWTGVGSSHAFGYGDDFVDTLLNWLLAQEKSHQESR